MYERCGFDASSSPTTLYMLSDLEASLEELLNDIAQMPEEYVAKAEKVRLLTRCFMFHSRCVSRGRRGVVPQFPPRLFEGGQACRNICRPLAARTKDACHSPHGRPQGVLLGPNTIRGTIGRRLRTSPRASRCCRVFFRSPLCGGDGVATPARMPSITHCCRAAPACTGVFLTIPGKREKASREETS